MVSSVDPVPGSEADEARDLRAVALLLIQHGRPEEAIAKLEAAIEASRSADDVAGEGEGEFLLAWTYRKIASTGEEHVRLVRLHASRAEAASRRAGDRAGLIDALSLLAIHFNERGDDANLRYTLAQLQLVDPGTASWLEGYTAAVASMFVDPHKAVGLFRQALGALDPKLGTATSGGTSACGSLPSSGRPPSRRSRRRPERRRRDGPCCSRKPSVWLAGVRQSMRWSVASTTRSARPRTCAGGSGQR